MKNILKLFILILSINLIAGCSNKKVEEEKIEVNRKKEQLLRKKEYEEAKIFIQAELDKANETMQTINSKMDEIENVNGRKSMTGEEFDSIKDPYNNMFYVFSGKVADEGLNINNWGAFREMKELRQEVEWTKEMFDSVYESNLIMKYRQIKPRALEVDTQEFKNKGIVVSAVKDAIGKREGEYYLLGFKWGEYYKDYNITKNGDDIYSSHGKVEKDGIEYNFNIEFQISNGAVSLQNYSFEL